LKVEYLNMVIVFLNSKVYPDDLFMAIAEVVDWLDLYSQYIYISVYAIKAINGLK
jgi:hypothetical protein